MYRSLAKWSLNFHSFAYKLASALAIKAEGGLHPKHRLMNYHQFFLDHIEAGDRVLDIGCGNGALAFDLAKKAKEVVAIDLVPKNIEKATKQFARSNISYRVTDATSFEANQAFDVVVLSNVLEHIERRIDFLKKIKHLAPKFLIRVPMIDRDWITLYKKEMGVEYRLDKTHFTEYTLASFRDELTAAELNLGEYSIQFGEIWTTVNHE